MLSKNKEIHVCFVDIQKVFDKIRRSDVWESLMRKGIEEGMIKMIQALYKNSTN